MQRSLVLVACFLITVSGRASEPAQAAANADERAALAAGSALPQPVNEPELLSCQAVDGMTPHCGFQNPEDLVQIPGTDLLIVSEMGEFMADSPGALSLLDTATGQRQALTISWSSNEASWGDDGCPAPDAAAFSPHGIDLTRRDDGALALLAVNHGNREAVEFFAVAASGDLTWRGCALPPGDPFINDVAAKRDGGFYVTHMWDKSRSFEEIAAALSAGETTGWVWSWTPAGGFSRLPNTEDLLPNGIALSPDENVLYVNAYMGNRAFVLDLNTSRRLSEIEVRQPDNVSVDADGNLWIASHQHDPLGQTCNQVSEGPCLLPFQVVRTNAQTLESEVIIDHEGAPTGYATVALKVGNRLYLGTAHGDRVVSVDL